MIKTIKLTLVEGGKYVRTFDSQVHCVISWNYISPQQCNYNILQKKYINPRGFLDRRYDPEGCASHRVKFLTLTPSRFIDILQNQSTRLKLIIRSASSVFQSIYRKYPNQFMHSNFTLRSFNPVVPIFINFVHITHLQPKPNLSQPHRFFHL